jgi:tryptophan-rich sensory protein
MSLAVGLLSLPSWLALLVLVVAIVALSLLGFKLVSRRVPHYVMKPHNDVAGFIFATVGVMYGVILGFDIYMVWQDLSQAQQISALESGEALGLYRDLSLYPDTEAVAPVRRALSEFIQSVVKDEYPAMAKMQQSHTTEMAFDRLWGSLCGLRPNGPLEQIIYQEILEDLNRLAKFRLERLEAASQELPSVVWLTLVVGGVITICFTYFFGAENVTAHVVMTGLLAAMVATVVFVIVELDHPFMGEAAIKPDHYVRLLDYISIAR